MHNLPRLQCFVPLLVIFIASISVHQPSVAEASTVIPTGRIPLKYFLRQFPYRKRTVLKSKLLMRKNCLHKLFYYQKNYIGLNSTAFFTSVIKELIKLEKELTVLFDGLHTLMNEKLVNQIEKNPERNRFFSQISGLVNEADDIAKVIMELRKIRKQAKEYWCPRSWVTIGNQYCFNYYWQESTERNARIVCQQNNAKLVAPKDVPDIRGLFKMVKLRKSMADFWIDMTAACNSPPQGRWHRTIYKAFQHRPNVRAICSKHRCVHGISTAKWQVTDCDRTRHKVLCQRSSLKSPVNFDYPKP